MKIDVKFAADVITDAINAFDEEDTDWKAICVRLIAVSSHLAGIVEGLTEDEI